MKKIKLFALAALAMLGTNAMAVTGKSATKLFTFEWTTTGTDPVVKTAVITGFVSELDNEFKTSIAIPDSVTDGADATKRYHVIGIAESAFKGQPVASVSFYAPKKSAANSNLGDQQGIKTIGAGAFEGTNITTLDLTNTTITTVDNLFGTQIKTKTVSGKEVPDTDNADLTLRDKENSKLTSVTLPATVTSIANNAFANCTALATIDLTKATNLASAIGAGVFAGCPLTALDLSKNTKVTSLTANALFDGKKFTVTTLPSITLHKAFTALNGNLKGDVNLTAVNGLGDKADVFAIAANEFEGCTALATINTAKVKTFGNSAFKGCTALTTIALDAATSLGTNCFEASGLTAVTFPAEGLTAIPASCFFQCENLKTVTFTAKNKKTEVASIATLAFGYTAIETITIPEETVALVIAAKAFANCTSLKDFYFARNAAYDGTAYDIDETAFFRCSDVKFHTTKTFADPYAAIEGLTPPQTAPDNVTFDYSTGTEFKVTPIEGKTGKYYVKWYGDNIKVKASEAKVYAAYLEGDNTLNMIRYKTDSEGYSEIAANDAALIITEKADLQYEPGTASNTSWMTAASALYTDNEILTPGQNALKYVTTATTLSALQLACTDDSYEVYGFMKTGGFQKITTGNAIPKGTLFVFAKEPAAGGRLNVVWRDENGNIEAETTAIETVKTVAEDGAAYNAAGQQVGAGYKGLVIKNGKKFIVK